MPVERGEQGQALDASGTQVSRDRRASRGIDIVTRGLTGGNLPLEAAAIEAVIAACDHHHPLRYRAAMRKTTAKFALRKETVRELSRKELSRPAGGAETDAPANAVAQTRDKQCLAAAVAGG